MLQSLVVDGLADLVLDPLEDLFPMHGDILRRGNPETDLIAVHPEHGPGFDVWVGGGLSTNPMLARKMGVWVPYFAKTSVL